MRDKYAPALSDEEITLARLHPLYAELYKLVFIGSVPQTEVAKALGIHRNRVQKHMIRLNHAIAIIQKMPRCDIGREMRNCISKRDMVVLTLFLQCYSYAEVAEKLDISEYITKQAVTNAARVAPNANTMRYLRLAIDHCAELQRKRSDPVVTVVKRRKRRTKAEMNGE